MVLCGNFQQTRGLHLGSWSKTLEVGDQKVSEPSQIPFREPPGVIVHGSLASATLGCNHIIAACKDTRNHTYNRHKQAATEVVIEHSFGYRALTYANVFLH